MQYVGHQIRVANNMIKRYTDDNLCLPRSKDITAKVIVYLYESELEKKEVFQKEIRDKFEMSRSSVTGLIDRMTEKKFVVRKKSKKDGRLKRIVLTKKCKEKCDATFALLNSLEEVLVDGMSKEEKDTLMRLLEKVCDNIARAETKNEEVTKEVSKKE